MRATVARVDLAAITHNLKTLRAKARGAQVCAVVKANAYGHGALQVANVCLKNGATSLGVAITSEGAELREAGVLAPILVMGAGPNSRAEADEAVRHSLTQTVFCSSHLQLLEEAASDLNAVADVHIKIDSGMNRVGARTRAELDSLIKTFEICPHLRPVAAFTHMFAADDEPETAREQLSAFLALAQRLRAAFPSLKLHASNSAATLGFSEAHLDLIRPGIALYGGYTREELNEFGLRPALSLETRAVMVKDISKGEGVGYGHEFVAQRPTRVMTLPIGYADGYPRNMGRVGGVALVRGRRVPVIGRVCMDQTMLDVTDVLGASVDDIVTLIGSQFGSEITASEMAGWMNTISYEALCRISARVPRVYEGG